MIDDRFKFDEYLLIQYSDTAYRLIRLTNFGKENLNKNLKRKLTFNLSTEQEHERIALLRAKRKIREYALCNDFDFFVTITINSKYCNRFDLAEIHDKLKSKFEYMKRKNHSFKYVLICECHKNGAYHFHGLMSNIPTLYSNEFGFLSCKLLENLGFNSFFKIYGNYSKCVNYILKYISKDCQKFPNGYVYMNSRHLLKPDITILKDDDVENLGLIDWSFENKFCSYKDFTIDNRELCFFLSDLMESNKLADVLKSDLINFFDFGELLYS